MAELNTDIYIEIGRKVWDESDIEKIAESRGLTTSEVSLMLKYNILSFKQLSDLTGKSESQLRNDTIPRELRDRTRSVKLTICNPFPDTSKGKLFIEMDSKCKEYILKSI